ncbi:hypothetical protein BDB01DRAFT_792698 [Pilobolus umbonatus]|nr:hypothetical protein BDB01DRAFT_792698 [Pilobolus umbonatus]
MDPNPILCYPFSCEFSIPPDLCQFLFDATQTISLTMTICSFLWVGKILFPEGYFFLIIPHCIP